MYFLHFLKRRRSVFAALLLVLSLGHATAQTRSGARHQPALATPIRLKCNSWTAPLGIDVPNPDLSWTIAAGTERRGMRQTAYQVLVASSPALLAKSQGDKWNSGKVLSDKMLQVKYAGAVLASSRQYWWKVRVWDEQNLPSAWSQPTPWTMGILTKTQWQAQWITAAGAGKFAPVIEPRKTDFVEHRRHPATWVGNMPGPQQPNYSSMLLRKEFVAAPRLVRAVAHVCGLGQYELTLNGRKVGDQLLTPGWSSYDKTVLYDTYDVTSLLRPGANAVGLLLSNGLYNIQPDTVRYVKMLNTYGPLKAIAQLRLEYADGSVTTIGTDATWQVRPGPVTYMNLYGGEDYDAQLEPAGWNKPGFAAGKPWDKAMLASDSATLKGLSCAAAPVKAMARLTPIKMTRINAHTWVYDLGQNASIMPEIEISGQKGAFVRLIPAELLKADGTVDRSSATQDGVKPAWWQYTLGAAGRAKWFPKFFYQGGRYVQVELFAAAGTTELPALEKLTGVVVHSSAEAIGRFQCSNELFNSIYGLVRWAQRSNLMTVLTDCPHREKMPWLEQYHLNGPALRYNFDLANLFTKSMNDMADAQLTNGLVPNIAPEYFHAGHDWQRNGFRNSPEWGSAFLIVPWQQYLFSGDITLMQRYYARMKQYLAFLDANSQDNILTIGLGDWYDIGPKPAWGSQLTPTAFTATAIYFYDYEIMAKIAGILGQQTDAERFAQRKEEICQAFNKTFYKPEKGIYATGSNTTCAMPLFFNLVAPAQRQHLLQTLVDSLRGRHNSFTSGEVGYRFLLRSLADNGYSNVVYDMNNQTDRPGYGYQIKMGATSLTEKWDASVGSFGSQNHFMSGQINEWFFHDLLGINLEEGGAGFRKFSIKPTVVGDLAWAKGSYQSVSGLIATEWRRSGETLTLRVTVPANTSATVYVPARQASEVLEGKNLAAQAKGVKFLRMDSGAAVYQVGSGSYQFAAKALR